jgi:hypothetical protein
MKDLREQLESLPAIREAMAVANLGPASAADQFAVKAIVTISGWLGRLPGINPTALAQSTISCLEENTGLMLATLRQALPTPAPSGCWLNAFGVGQLLHLSAAESNGLLAACGLQARNARGEWILTDAGREWGEARPFERDGKKHSQLLWSPAVIDLLNDSLS